MYIQSHTPSKSTVNIANMGVGRGAGGFAPLNFEIWHFSIKFLAEMVVFLASSGWNENSSLLVKFFLSMFVENLLRNIALASNGSANWRYCNSTRKTKWCGLCAKPICQEWISLTWFCIVVSDTICHCWCSFFCCCLIQKLCSFAPVSIYLKVLKFNIHILVFHCSKINTWYYATSNKYYWNPSPNVTCWTRWNRNK